MRVFLLSAAVAMIAGGAAAQAACPNAATSVTIPLTGSAAVTVYDQSCDVLSPPFTIQDYPSSGGNFALSATTAPAFTASGSAIELSANGAAAASSGQMIITHTPSGKTTTITFVVGAPVSSISIGTTTP